MNMEAIGSTDDERVACIITCCDKRPYSLPDKGYDKNCQRLGSRKHSCVFRNARELEKSGKSKIKASPRYTAEKYPDLKPLLDSLEKKSLIPDIVIGNRVIDAKFPCDPEQVKNTTGSQKLSQPSVVGKTMNTAKEDDIYPDLPGIDSSKPMKPDQAEKAKGNCDCRSVNK
jgi:hypothetical protein